MWRWYISCLPETPPKKKLALLMQRTLPWLPIKPRTIAQEPVIMLITSCEDSCAGINRETSPANGQVEYAFFFPARRFRVAGLGGDWSAELGYPVGEEVALSQVWWGPKTSTTVDCVAYLGWFWALSTWIIIHWESHEILKCSQVSYSIVPNSDHLFWLLLRLCN